MSKNERPTENFEDFADLRRDENGAWFSERDRAERDELAAEAIAEQRWEQRWNQ